MTRRCFSLILCLPTLGALHAQNTVRLRTASPVSIVAELNMTQTLADGTHIHRVSHEWFYRDSLGRTLIKRETEFIPAPAGNTIFNFTVFDPIAGETMFWSVGPGLPLTYTRSKPEPARAPASAPPRTQAPVKSRVTIKRENLGTDYVRGFPCNAYRTTTTYPVDSVGNDRPIVVSNESCQSAEFGRPLKVTSEDPQSGTGTMVVTSISREEPDPALFQPPAGYTGRLETPVVSSVPAQNSSK